MAKKKANGLQSSAGLTRYYEADKKAIAVKPLYVIVAGFVVAFVVLLVAYFYGAWPLSG